MDNPEGLTRSEIRDLIMREAGISKTLKAMALFYIQTMPEAEVQKIGTVSLTLLDALRDGDINSAVATMQEYGIPEPFSQIIEQQMRAYAAKIGNDQIQ